METARYDLVVVGGGPAGSTAAAVASRAGLKVLLLEGGSHPRPHVGESLAPGIAPILDAMGALDAVRSGGFVDKTGATYRGWGRTGTWDVWFSDSEATETAWLADRAGFDAVLFQAAVRAGATVHEHAPAEAFLWERDRVVGVEWAPRGGGRRSALAPFTIDATGQATTLARSLGLREMLDGLKHEASWAHCEGAGRLPPPRDRQALFAATEGEWVWHFPISDALTSVGVVTTEGGPPGAGDRTERFDRFVAQSEALTSILGPSARRVTPVRTEVARSYRVARPCGPGWILAGDASGFIDPVLSSGVLLAMQAGSSAAALVAEVARGALAEHDLYRKYEVEHRRRFDDALRAVKLFYERRLGREDYFWESKRAFVGAVPEVRPWKSLPFLTSGLVEDLAFGAGDEGRAPDSLSFVCIQLRYAAARPPAALYVVLEPRDPHEPALFRTTHWHVTCLAPRFADPMSEPGIAPSLRALERALLELDTRTGETLASFWRRARHEVAAAVAAFPRELGLVRVYGE